DCLVGVAGGERREGGVPELDVGGASLYARLAFTVGKLVVERGEEVMELLLERPWLVVELVKFGLIWEDAQDLEVVPPWKGDVSGLVTRDEISGVAKSFVADRAALEIAAVQKFVDADSVAGSALVAASQAAVTSGGKYLRVLERLINSLATAGGREEASVTKFSAIIERLLSSGHTEKSLPILKALASDLQIDALISLLQKVVKSVADVDKSSVFEASSPSISLVVSLQVLLDALSKRNAQDRLSQAQILLLVRHIRGWYEGTEGLRIGKSLRLDAAISAVLRLIVQMRVEVGVNMTGFVFAICEKWVLELEIGDPQARVVLYEVLLLWRGLVDAAREDPQVWETVERHEQQVQEHVLELFLKAGDIQDHAPTATPQAIFLTLLAEMATNTPEDILLQSKPVSQLTSLLYLPNEEVHKTAFSLLRRITREYIQATSLKVEMRSSEDPTGAEEKLPEAVVKGAKKEVADVEVGVVDLATHAGFGYLLSWMVLLDHFEDATFQLKANYISHVRSLDALPHFLEYVFGLLGVGWAAAPFDLSRWDFQSFDVEAFEMSSTVGFPLLAAHLYWRILRHAPSLVRIWWMECKNRQLTLAVESYTEKYFSSELIRTELDLLTTADKSTLEDLTIKASKAANEVFASYTIEDTNLDIVIR
ncbi:hypothetical protein HK097_005530, partial [Rhizophlyctis rosea]